MISTKYVDLIGQRFGKLEVLKQGETKEVKFYSKVQDKYYTRKKIYLTCKCDCGNIKDIPIESLTKKKPTKSCGCLMGHYGTKPPQEIKPKEIGGQRFTKLVAVKRLPRPENYPHKTHRQTYQWECLCDCGNTTIVTVANLMNGQTQSCGCLKKDISKRKLENLHNVSKEFLDTIGYDANKIKPYIKKSLTNYRNKRVRGIYYNKATEKWIVSISFLGERHHLGSFMKKRDAIYTRKLAESYLFDPIVERYNEIFNTNYV